MTKQKTQKNKKSPILTIVLGLALVGIGIFLRKTSAGGVQNGDLVGIEYTAYYEDGEIFDTNNGGSLLEFTVGSGEVITGLEKAVIGMTVDKSKTVTISPEDGYGKNYNPKKINKVNGIVFDTLNITPETGQFYQFNSTEGVVTEIQKDGNNKIIIMDVNPRHTRQDLKYEITVKTIKE